MIVLLIDVIKVKLLLIVHLWFTFHSYVLHRVALPQSMPLVVSDLGCGKSLLSCLQIYDNKMVLLSINKKSFD